MNKSVVMMIVLFISVFLGGCASLQEIIKKPTLEFQGLTMKDTSLFQSTLVFDYAVSNSNPIGLSLDQIDYQVKINEKNIAKGHLDKTISIPGNGKTNVEIPVDVQYMDFFNSIAEFFKKDEVTYDLSGSMGKFGVQVPFHKKGTIPVPKLPQVSLNRIDIKDLSFAKASLVVVLDLVNKNDFKVGMDSLDYKVTLGNSELTNGKTISVGTIKENGKSVIELPVNLNLLQLGQAAYQLLLNASSEYEVSGNFQFQVPNIGQKDVAFSKKGKVPIQK
ncbi:hypothetical protein Dvar_03220 [Desulfosarcina variabilis str. Montpellier]|uniref:LEA type 2 family protein n=1 Tax=Desulfosarcina variabilis TaxID=2300 RepID=UPI003AFA063D